MTVRSNLDFLKSWIDDRIADIVAGKTPIPDKTFAWYWVKNGEDSRYFDHKDVVFECFHNFVAFSQWGNSIYNIMLRLARGTAIRDPGLVQGDYGRRSRQRRRRRLHAARALRDGVVPARSPPTAAVFPRLERTRAHPQFDRHGYIISPHTSTSIDPVHWENPESSTRRATDMFRRAHEIDEAKAKQIGFANARST